MKIIPWIIALVAVLVAVYFWSLSRDQDQTALRVNEKTKIELDAARDSLEIVTARVDSIQTAEATFRTRLEKQGQTRDSLRQIEIKGHKSKIAQLRQDRSSSGVKPDTSTVKIEAEFEAQQARDSVEIATLKVDARAANESHTREKEAMDDKLDAQLDVSVKAITRVEVLEKQLVKERKRGKIFKWLFYAAAAGFIFESVKD